ncbi:methyl-accepting chemotaxis protein [Povalibacter uvarum]|uniref:Methyl-accepting chemotaxis protein n=1 Tax=Povalibacter uvarum TaxID=732238 RepID=A0A841HPQ7_9GAMM|nr:methyl-accepting chemotaxis protein [Povalibacter uvarum]MBB6094032.1 methyl-accepting chemotaxis protein [Povalibacter uvarum]
MRLTIRTRLVALVAIMLALMLVLGGTGWRGMSAAGSGLQNVVVTGTVLRNHMEGDMMHDALRADVLASLLAQSDDEKREAKTQLQEHSQHFREMIAANNELATGEAHDALSAVGPALNTYISSAEKIVETAATDKQAASAMLPSFLSTFSELEDQLSTVSDGIEKNAADAEQDANATISSAHVAGGILLAVAAVVALITSLLVMRRVTTGIDTVMKSLDRMADGELGFDMPRHNGDELGQLLTTLHKVDQKFVQVVGTVRYNADTVGAAARQLSGGNDDLSQRTQEQAAALQQTAASMEEMSATVKQNADNARAANQLAASARNQADRGGTVVQQAVAAMAEISNSSRKIGEIIGVIDSIAFQTNLLALNAAVEAARAGEQGRGFAVVASEVRNLAQRSATAAREIKTLIGESVDKVKAGSDLVDLSGKTIAEIMESVRKVTDIVAEISAASEEQATGIEQVNRAVSQMDVATQENAALVEESAAASKTMEQQTQSLVSEVSFFRLRTRGETMRHGATDHHHDASEQPAHQPEEYWQAA